MESWRYEVGLRGEPIEDHDETQVVFRLTLDQAHYDAFRRPRLSDLPRCPRTFCLPSRMSAATRFALAAECSDGPRRLPANWIGDSSDRSGTSAETLIGTRGANQAIRTYDLGH